MFEIHRSAKKSSNTNKLWHKFRESERERKRPMSVIKLSTLFIFQLVTRIPWNVRLKIDIHNFWPHTK